jgi:ATP-dependent Lhr-like helicase
MPSILERFHPVLRSWFERRFNAPSRAQELGWPVIAGAHRDPSHDVLLCAPTGSGKTLAAFMWAINLLVVEAEQGALQDEVSVLYVSPLKALANDIRLNLEEPLEGAASVARETGIKIAHIRAGLRTGDTPANERSAMLRRPPHILVTTPESLFILLTSARFRDKLKSVRHVIVDELHAIAGNKRGAHLMLTLERLERMVMATGAPRPTRIGLSATLNPIERLAEFLAGAAVSREGIRTPRPIKIVRADDRARHLDLRVVIPGPELGPIATHPHWEALYDELARLIGEHRTTLVFTLSRRAAERVAVNLQKRLGTDAVMAHHGSLARKERLDAEQRLKRGELKAIVATASLELGIDVGAVELVCQVDTPKSISAAIQRVGRSGHSLGATPKGRFFAMSLDDLIDCAAAVRAIRAGRLDEVEIPTGCIDVVAQQIVAIAAEQGEDGVSERELLGILRSAYNFADLTEDAIRQLLKQMASELNERIFGAAPKIFYDARRGRVTAKRGARMAAITSGGTIPENGNYDVVIESQGRKIGDVEEDFAQESSRGDVFTLGSMPWQISRISRGRLLVEPAPGATPTLPFWLTEAAGRSWGLSAEQCDVRREVARCLESGGEADATAFLENECLLDEGAARQAVDYIRRGVAALGAVPDERTIVVERFFDGLGGTQIVIHAPFGIRFNRALGLSIRKKLCQNFDFEIQASAIDDACLLALNARHSFPLEDVLHMVSSRNARGVLTQAILNAPMFETRFRHVASRALAIMRSNKGDRIPAYLQRLRSQELLAAIFPGQQACFENRPPEVELPDHFILTETIRECLEESTDATRMETVLRGLEDGSIRAVTVDSIAPSVFAHRLLLAWDYSFLDDGERANRRSRTVQMNRGMAEDVLRSEDLSEMLSREAIDGVVGEITCTALNRRARSADELCEIIRVHGGLSIDEIAQRVRGDSDALLDELRREGRIVAARPTPIAPGIFVTFEDAPLYRSVYAEASFGADIATTEQPDPDASRDEIVRRAFKTSGPATPHEMAQRLHLADSEITGSLTRLETSGAIFRGHFTAGNVQQWCDRYVLQRIHRETLAKVRAEVEPCKDHEFAAFLMQWHHIGGAGLEIDVAQTSACDPLAAVLDQLTGLTYTPEIWERSILPARVPGYRPELLDLLCLGGQFAWVALPPEDEIPDLPSKVAFVNRHERFLFQAADDEAPADANELAIWRVLIAAGAQYLDQVADRAEVSERDALAALWKLAARGRVSNDSFAPLRLFASAPDAARLVEVTASRGRSRRDAAMRARLKSSVSGRWSALAPRKTDAPDSSDRPREIAMLLLHRHGILAREVMALESINMPWSEIQFALRRLEYGGTIRRGWFVHSLSGEQYALPEAVEMLRAMRGANPAREKPVAISAIDPANPYGAILKGCEVARETGNMIVVRGGQLILALAGHAILTGTSILKDAETLDDESFSAAAAALMTTRGKLRIDTIDGVPALESSRVGLLAAMRFHSDGRALVYDGLPGPSPMRARFPARH